MWLSPLQLPPTLLSRFDLIYLLLDPEKAENDRQLATHLVSLYQHPDDRPAPAISYYTPAQVRAGRLYGRTGQQPSVAQENQLVTRCCRCLQVTEYISYARAHCRPRISEEVSESARAHRPAASSS